MYSFFFFFTFIFGLLSNFEALCLCSLFDLIFLKKKTKTKTK